MGEGTSSDGEEAASAVFGFEVGFENCLDEVGAFEEEGGTSGEAEDFVAGVGGAGVCCSRCAWVSDTAAGFTSSRCIDVTVCLASRVLRLYSLSSFSSVVKCSSWYGS